MSLCRQEKVTWKKGRVNLALSWCVCEVSWIMSWVVVTFFPKSDLIHAMLISTTSQVWMPKTQLKICQLCRASHISSIYSHTERRKKQYNPEFPPNSTHFFLKKQNENWRQFEPQRGHKNPSKGHSAVGWHLNLSSHTCQKVTSHFQRHWTWQAHQHHHLSKSQLIFPLLPYASPDTFITPLISFFIQELSTWIFHLLYFVLIQLLIALNFHCFFVLPPYA